MVGKILDKYRIDSTEDGVWTPVPGTTGGRKAVEVVGVQWSETDGSSTLEIEGAKTREDHTREDLISASIVLLSIAGETNEQIPLQFPKLICPLYYKDNGGGSNKLIIKVQDSN